MAKKKYQEGGITEGMNPNIDDDTRARAMKFVEEKVETAAPARKQSFREAFAQARQGGEKTFEWNGKKYTTEMAKPATRAAAPDTGDETARLARRPMPAKREPYETPYDRMNRQNREAAAARVAKAAPARAALRQAYTSGEEMGMKKGGMVGKASKRADGIAQRGKTKGRMV